MTTVAILLAGGSGLRMQLDRPKAFVQVGGRTLLEHALLGAVRGMTRGSSDGGSLVVVAPEGREAEATRTAERCVAGLSVDVSAVVTGADTRGGSVRRALEAVPDDAAEVLCHDVARPFATASVWHRVRAALADAEAVVPVVSLVDTVKRVGGGAVVETLSRDELVQVQTPQAFRRSVLERAHREAADAGIEASDDAALVERLGYRVMTVEGERFNMKVTVPEDLVVAEAIAAHRVAIHAGPEDG